MKGGKRGLLLLALAVVTLLSPSAWAAKFVTDVQLVIPVGVMYQYTGPSGNNAGVFQLQDMGGSPTVTINEGHLKTFGAAGFDYDLVNATLLMDTSALNLDSSYTQSYFLNPKVAKGRFNGGATMSLLGSIKDRSTNSIVFTGTILQTYVSGDFWVQEWSTFPANTMDSRQNMIVTGGELAGPGVTGLQMLDFLADYLFVGCQQDGNTSLKVEDFQSTIYNGPGSTIHFTASAPEPVCLSLLALGSFWVLKKRRIR
jgi:hypothetical protein